MPQSAGGPHTGCDFQKEIAPFYKNMDLNVPLSKNEGLGLALLEALAADVPCIGSDSGCIREIITDDLDGLLFRHGDYTELAEKIRIIRDDKTRRDFLSSNARGNAKRLFDVGRTVEETEEIFYGLLAKRGEKRQEQGVSSALIARTSNGHRALSKGLRIGGIRISSHFTSYFSLFPIIMDVPV